MGFSVSLPTIGQPNSTEDVKVNNSLTAISTWGNGNVLGSDLSPTAAIARSQLAGGFGNLAATAVGVNTSVVDGKLYLVNTGSTTMTLPAPTANVTIGVLVNAVVTGATPVTVARSSTALIVGMGAPAATSIALGALGAFVVLVADGTNWFIVSGQQDTGWTAISLGAGVSAATGYTPAVRLQGDRVTMCGALSGSGITAWGTVPVGYRPASQSSLCNVTLGGSSTVLILSTAGALTTGASGSFMALDGLNYRLT